MACMPWSRITLCRDSRTGQRIFITPSCMCQDLIQPPFLPLTLPPNLTSEISRIRRWRETNRVFGDTARDHSVLLKQPGKRRISHQCKTETGFSIFLNEKGNIKQDLIVFCLWGLICRRNRFHLWSYFCNGLGYVSQSWGFAGINNDTKTPGQI
jgi:hypothetical protein